MELQAKTFRSLWTPHADNVTLHPYRIVNWYDGDLMRLRVGYWVDMREARLLVRRLGGGWKAVECRRWDVHGKVVTPSAAALMARAWLSEAAAARVANPVGVRQHGRLVTVRR